MTPAKGSQEGAERPMGEYPVAEHRLDSSTELIDVVGRPEPRIAPHLFAQRFGEPLLE